LPQIWYQIQNKFRMNAAKAGLLRVRQFTMKDSYSFDIDEAAWTRATICTMLLSQNLQRSGLKFVAVERTPAQWAARDRRSSWCTRTRGEDSSQAVLLRLCRQS